MVFGTGEAGPLRSKLNPFNCWAIWVCNNLATDTKADVRGEAPAGVSVTPVSDQWYLPCVRSLQGVHEAGVLYAGAVSGYDSRAQQPTLALSNR